MYLEREGKGGGRESLSKHRVKEKFGGGGGWRGSWIITWDVTTLHVVTPCRAITVGM